MVLPSLNILVLLFVYTIIRNRTFLQNLFDIYIIIVYKQK
jgi:hypothetical protein